MGVVELSSELSSVEVVSFSAAWLALGGLGVGEGDDSVEGAAVVGGGAALEVLGGGGGGLEVLSLSSSSEPPEPPEPPDPSKATMCAVLPLGTVTTQKEEPPAPTAASLLWTLLPGLISQGRPLHPPSGHSIRTPKSGAVEPRLDDCQTGL